MPRFKIAALAGASCLIALTTAAQGIAQNAGHAGHGSAGAAPAAAPVAHAATLEAALASPVRTAADRARDQYRHPAETLRFFGLRPDMTVVEIWPGGGWYTKILAPYVQAGGGTYYAAGPAGNGLNGVRALMAADAVHFGAVKLAEFPAQNPAAMVPNGTADLVMTFRNVHNWGANSQTAFDAMFAMLKPGGTLGVVEHRLPEEMDAALETSSGYMKRSSVVALARQAGFELVGESDINANPRDTHDYPKGVWTLPPNFAEGDTDRAKYAAIGESDRMTLRFRKPR